MVRQGEGLRLGLDIGSTTAKLALLDHDNKILHTDYGRHNAKVSGTIVRMLRALFSEIGDRPVSVAVTGSAGMGVSERNGLPFVQEVIAAAETVRALYPDVRTLVDVGGEDSKMIFFDERMRVDIRMNGNCAGGTGSFIDQMATLLDVGLAELDEMAGRAERYHPMASRCGVFAKTDVQTLLSTQVPKDEIAASIYNSVAIQTVSTLSRGYDPRPKVLFCGGPFTFLKNLKGHYMRVMDVKEEDVVSPDRPELVVAMGAALHGDIHRYTMSVSELIGRLSEGPRNDAFTAGRLEPLFEDREEMEEWLGQRMAPVEQVSSPEDLGKGKCFLGIDSGSTTSKICLIDDRGRTVFTFYTGNRGDPIDAVRRGLEELRRELEKTGLKPEIAFTAVTGYGEELIKAAFGLDIGIVETLAHYRAASEFLPDVSFILDIGGQDMKAVFIRGGIINDIEINEACSSGCGSFLETFSGSLGMDIEDFAMEACRARSPYDLGTRCTVFMNSKVKQALREGAEVGDISAGLALSVVRNCLYKVLKIKDTDVLGEKIVVQGGTFRNPAVHRALELILGKRVVCSDRPEMMGAVGAALTARDRYIGKATSFIGLEHLDEAEILSSGSFRCSGCSNRCSVSRFEFAGERVYFAGNRCERVFSNSGERKKPGRDLTAEKLSMLFEIGTKPDVTAKGTIGIPRVLNIFDSFPFWSTLLVNSGFKVVLSPPSGPEMLSDGSRTVMSESICMPAKLVNGHILELTKMEVDRIFYPIVVYEEGGADDTLNTFNCPVVSGYPDVIRSAIDPQGRYGIPFDTPAVTFKERRLLKKACRKYLRSLGVDRSTFERSFKAALDEQDNYREKVREAASGIIEEARNEEAPLVLLLGRPYHADRLINHSICEMITGMGAHLITEDSIPVGGVALKDIDVLTQWEYPNRIYRAVKWARERENVHVVQLNSFGCGPDALVCDEVRSLLSEKGRGHTLIRIDEVTSQGSIRLRLRSMMESLKARDQRAGFDPVPRKTTPVFGKQDRSRKLIAPHFSDHYSPLITAAFASMGIDLEVLPPTDRESVECGLKYCNNEICYPAIIVIGDIIKALGSGKYDLDRVTAGITQTGGQCRASSYLSLLRKGLVSAGFEDVPVISVSLSSQDLNEQPGMKVDRISLMRKGMQGLLFADSIMQMHNSTAYRELKKGSSRALAERYISMASEAIRYGREGELLSLLKRAVNDFNRIDVDEDEHPTVGFVGEIYVKYNPFGQYHVVDWMLEQGIEVVVPPLFDFFAQEIHNKRFSHENNTKDSRAGYLLSYPMEWFARYQMKRYGKVRRGFSRNRENHYVGDLAKIAGEVVTLVDQFGEGWLIPAEIGAFARDGIDHVVCVQPFGCISNHIIGKGVERALKERYPNLNVLYLDMDAGSSEVNIYNRLNFLVRAAKDDLSSGRSCADIGMNKEALGT